MREAGRGALLPPYGDELGASDLLDEAMGLAATPVSAGSVAVTPEAALLDQASVNANLSQPLLDRWSAATATCLLRTPTRSAHC